MKFSIYLNRRVFIMSVGKRFSCRVGSFMRALLCIKVKRELHKSCLPYKMLLLASVAQPDARPTGDQEVAGSTPAGSATFFRGD